MRKIIYKLSDNIKCLLNDSLYKNAGYLLGVNLIGAILSFIFWVISVRFFSQEEIGIASAIISISSFLAIISGLGVGPGLIRHLSEEKDSILLLKTTIINNIILSLVVGVIYLFYLDIKTSQNNVYLTQNIGFSVGIMIFIGLISLSSLVQFSFQGFRESRFAFWHIILWDILGLILLLVFHYLGFQQFGVVPIQALSLFFANIVSYFYFLPKLIKNYSFRFEYSFSRYKNILPYSIGSFIADLLYRAPLLITPTIVLNILDAKASASVYFAWMIGWMITSPGQSLAASVFSEGSSNPEKVVPLLFRSLRNALLVTIFLSMITFIISPELLVIFGKSYSLGASPLLKWLALSTTFAVLNSLYFSILKVEKRINKLFSYCLLSVSVYFITTVIFIGKLGIVSTGIGWLLSQLIVLLFASKDLLKYAKKK